MKKIINKKNRFFLELKKKIKNKKFLYTRYLYKKLIKQKRFPILDKKRKKKIWFTSIKIKEKIKYTKLRNLNLNLNFIYYWIFNLTNEKIKIIKKNWLLNLKKNNRQLFFNILKKKFSYKKLIKKRKKKYFYLKNLFKIKKKLKMLEYKIYIKYINKFFKINKILLLLLNNKYFKFNIYYYLIIIYIKFEIFKKSIFNEIIYLYNKFKDKLKFKIYYFLNKKNRHILFNVKKQLQRNWKSLKNQTYILYFRKVESNFFVTLTNNKNKVIISKSMGQVSHSRNKKKKMSYFLLKNLLFPIRKFFFKKTRFRKHCNYIIKIKSVPNKYIKLSMSLLKDIYRTHLKQLILDRPLPHHLGQRKKKMKRL